MNTLTIPNTLTAQMCLVRDGKTGTWSWACNRPDCVNPLKGRGGFDETMDALTAAAAHDCTDDRSRS